MKNEETLKKAIENRNSKGKFIKTFTPKQLIANKKLYRQRYFEKHPWAKNFAWAKVRAKRKGLTFTLTLREVEALWIRDTGWFLTKPSIDRIEGHLGYTLANCRFIEHSENARLGNTNRPTSVKQRLAGGSNLKVWRNNNPPWNKGVRGTHYVK